VLLIALGVELVSMLAFAEARSVEWLFAARVLQGIATGLAMGSLSAALLDLGPAERPWLGGLMGVVAPMTGLAAGALATGLLVELAPSPTTLVFWLLSAAFVLSALVALAVPETVIADGAWRASLRPRVGVPIHVRAAFVRALPSLTATWALGGLILSLGPSLTATVLGDDSHLAGGLPIFVMAGVSALASVAARTLSPRATARYGLVALIAGVAVAVGALATGSNAAFLLAAAIAGLGFGPAFAGNFRALADLAPPQRRAELVSAVLTVAYVAFSVPAVVAGVAVTQVGLRETGEVYGAALIVLAGLALFLSRGLDDARPPGTAVAVGASAEPS
jgi:MFS family permease